jgi:hypothetical protein
MRMCLSLERIGSNVPAGSSEVAFQKELLAWSDGRFSYLRRTVLRDNVRENLQVAHMQADRIRDTV